MGGIIDALFGGGGKETQPPAPPVVQRDVRAEQREAEDEAAKKANAARIAVKRYKAGGASLLTTGARGVQGDAATTSTLATGKTTLGQ